MWKKNKSNFFLIPNEGDGQVISNGELFYSMDVKLELKDGLPKYPAFKEGVRRAPMREFTLTEEETALAVQNALRYIPEEYHEQLIPEFLDELLTKGRIYGYRFRPEGELKGNPIVTYEGKCIEGKAFQVMIDNNLDFDIALYPYELVTYGESGRVFFRIGCSFSW